MILKLFLQAPDLHFKLPTDPLHTDASREHQTECPKSQSHRLLEAFFPFIFMPHCGSLSSHIPPFL